MSEEEYMEYMIVLWKLRANNFITADEYIRITDSVNTVWAVINQRKGADDADTTDQEEMV